MPSRTSLRKASPSSGCVRKCALRAARFAVYSSLSCDEKTKAGLPIYVSKRVGKTHEQVIVLDTVVFQLYVVICPRLTSWFPRCHAWEARIRLR